MTAPRRPALRDSTLPPQFEELPTLEEFPEASGLPDPAPATPASPPVHPHAVPEGKTFPDDEKAETGGLGAVPATDRAPAAGRCPELQADEEAADAWRARDVADAVARVRAAPLGTLRRVLTREVGLLTTKDYILSEHEREVLAVAAVENPHAAPAAMNIEEAHRRIDEATRATMRELAKAEVAEGGVAPWEAPAATTSGTEEGPVEDWPTLRPEALHGLAGEVVRTILPHTEADGAGLLADFLTTFGAMVGAGPHTVADAAKHPARLFTCLVGETSRSRKGTSRANVGRVFDVANEDFGKSRLLSGLSTGEGLINAVTDGTKTKAGILVGAVEDKRLLVYEPEFARVLKVAARDSATLSAILRDAWDRGNLRVITRKDPLSATGAHISILGHVTAEELRRNLTETEIANGLANRFLFVFVRRSKRLPHGGGLTEKMVDSLGQRVRGAIQRALALGRLERSPEANILWEGIYAVIEDDREGLYGAVTARAEAQILRLSLVYALIEGSHRIEREHLLAGLAVWEYAENSARILFGNAFGDEVSERLYRAIETAGDDGLDVADQMEAFGRNIKAARLAAARRYLERRNLIRTTIVKTMGRPRTVSVMIRGATPSRKGEGLYSAFFVPLQEKRRGERTETGTKEGEQSTGGDGERESVPPPSPPPSLSEKSAGSPVPLWQDAPATPSATCPNCSAGPHERHHARCPHRPPVTA